MNEVVLICAFLLIVWLVLRPKIWHDPKSTPSKLWERSAYQRRAGLFTGRSEASFFLILKSQLPSGYHLFAKVRLEDILKPHERFKGEVRWSLRGRIKSRHVDFLVCRENGDFVFAIELDDISHTKRDAKMVDRFKDEIFASAGLPLYRVRTSDNFYKFCTQLRANLT